MDTLAFQYSVIKWCRYHRVHHKFSETDADPHNAKRGFFFAHVGWILTKKHPEVKSKGKTIDLSDLTNDPILSFQHKHYFPLVIFTSFFLPTVVPMYFWGETFQNAWYLNLLRYCLSLNITWLVNSAAHLYGGKPYNSTIKFFNTHLSAETIKHRKKDIIMPPFRCTPTGVLLEVDEDIHEVYTKDDQKPREYAYVWKNIILFSYLHLSAVYAIYLVFSSAKPLTTVQGITCGAHRLWSHRAYKVKLPLKIILVIMDTLAFQNSVIEWCRDHRVHHKFSETDADPHNAKRGFFFAHMGWLLTKKHPEVKSKGKTIDISDLTNDPILSFQHKHYLPLVIFTSFFLPTAVPMYFWGETFRNAWYLNLLRYCLSLNITWLVNSAAHLYGGKPYDRYINPTENFSVATLTLGEGWHNYHHTFPWDYKASEFGKYSLNLSTAFIDFFAKIHWAYDLKVVSKDIIKRRVFRTGDGTHHDSGWADEDISEEYIQNTIISKNN
ncbi:Desat1 [Trypoxylus dichotomus]